MNVYLYIYYIMYIYEYFIISFLWNNFKNINNCTFNWTHILFRWIFPKFIIKLHFKTETIKQAQDSVKYEQSKIGSYLIKMKTKRTIKLKNTK